MHLFNLWIFFVFYSCVYLPILIWKKGQKIKYKTILFLFLLISIILQIYVGLFDFLSKDPSVNQQKVLWVLDIPNLLSVVIMGYLIFIIKKRIQ